MKIFISWSGERSLQVANLLNDWISCVIQAVEPWLSSEDLEKGSVWFSEITDKLANTNNGIVCLTKENLNKPWILFESGALAKGLASNRVFTFLIDLEPIDIKDPLAQFNHTMPTRNSMYRLVSTINRGLGEKALKEKTLKNVFDTYWQQFEEDLKKILKNTENIEKKTERPNDELLSEILYSVRGIDRRLRDLEYEKRQYSDLGFGFNQLDLPLEDLDLSVRAYNSLKANKVNLLKDLVRLDTHEILGFRNFSKKSLVEIEALLSERGLAFGMDV